MQERRFRQISIVVVDSMAFPRPPSISVSRSSPSLTNPDSDTIVEGSSASRTRPTVPPPSPGAELGRYVVLGQLGVGGMGVVLRAYDPRLQREVALKRMRSDVLEDLAAERMVREAQAMAQLAHPNVVAVYDVERLDATVLLAMELVEGTTLGKWLRESEPAWSRILEVFVQAGRGLAAAHAAGLVHRDFKPDNVLVGADGRVRVTDFGLARALGERPASERGSSPPASLSGSHSSLHSAVTQAGTVMGTPAYMAPEQHVGEEADAQADQFAFCVTLWEALTGKRPFTGDFRQLARAKLAGPPDWPRDSPVPRPVVEAIRRGLVPAPERRWPSMGALLTLLDRDPARTRLRWITVGAVAIASVATAGAVAGWWSRAPAVCEGARDHLVDVWDEPRRAATGVALRATEVEYAQTTLTEVTRRLDDYGERWVEMHTAACEATSVRHEQSAAILDLRMGCLQRSLDALDAAAEVLGRADAEVIEGAISLVAGLPPLSSCADVAVLQAAVPPPQDPALARAVEHARHELARAQASDAVGGHAEALTILDGIAEEALAYEPLRAELDLARGLMLLDLRRYEEAEALLAETYQRALRVDHRQTAVGALTGLGFLIGARRMREDEGLWLLRTALAMAQQIGLPQLEAVVLNDLGGVLDAHAHHDEAIAQFDLAFALQREQLGEVSPTVATTLTNKALALQQRGDLQQSFELRGRILELERALYGESHPRVAHQLRVMGNALHQRGEYEASAEYFEQAVAMFRALMGPTHPDTANALSGLGLALSALGRHAEAEQHIRAAYEILEQGQGIDRLELIDTLNNLAIIVDAQARYEEALELHRRVLEATEQEMGADHPRTAVALNNVAGELVTLRRYDEALPMLERAVEIQRKALSPGHPHLAVFEVNVADALVGLGRDAEAEEIYRRAIPVLEGAFGADHVYVSYGVIGLGRALLAQGEREQARALLERGLVLRAQDGVPDSHRAEAAFSLARALGDDDRARARTLARDARALLVKSGPGHRRELLEIDAWLDAH